MRIARLREFALVGCVLSLGLGVIGCRSTEASTNDRPGGVGGQTSSPSVVSMTPGDEQDNVTVGHVVQAQFNNRMDATSIIGGGFQVLLNGGAVPGKVTLSADGKTASFAPSALWAPGASY